jgi:predicted transcriptional regulator
MTKKHENLDNSFKDSFIRLGLSATHVLRCISDKEALSLFKAVALSENNDISILITKLVLTRKQYYSSMKKLIHTDLVKKISGRYSLSSFGRVI